jgi:phosphohistidine phosphatase SixA
MRKVIGAAALVACSLFGSAQSAQTGGGHIFVVRHAEKESETADALSSQGKARATCLAETLKDSKIAAVIVSPTDRAKQTAAPTAAEFKIETKSIKPDDYAAIATAAREALRSGNVLIVGHSNTVPLIVKTLGSVDVTVGASEYDRLFVLDSAGVAQLHYCPTSAAEPESRMK